MAGGIDWDREFDEPITTPDGIVLITLREAIAWLNVKIPNSEHSMKQVQAAAHCLVDAAERNGPIEFARISVMQAINRHRVRELSSSQKTTHWAKRKLKRDE